MASPAWRAHRIPGLYAADSPAEITTIGIITADRPVMAHRAVDSFSRHAQSRGRQPRLVVIDGSRQPDNQRATREVVERAAPRSRCTLQYVGRAEAARWRAALADVAPSARLLTPGAAGANRNLLLLLTAGERVLSVDDDVLAEPWRLTGRTDRLVLAGHQDLRTFAVFPTRAAALRAAVRSDDDLLESHSSLLDRELPDLVASSPAPDLSRACAHVKHGLFAPRPMRVRVTFSGLAGDAASYCPYRVLLASGPANQALRSDPSAFELAMTRREVLRIAPARIVTHASNCMAYCMAMSNRALLPPFLHAGGNEDGVFGLLVAATDRAALFGHLPVGVIHDSDRPPEYSGPAMQSARECRVSELIIALVRSIVAAGVPSSPAARMKAIGHGLIAAATNSPGEFRALVARITLQTRRQELAAAVRAAATAEASQHWLQALASYTWTFEQHAQAADFVLPAEYRRGSSIERSFKALQLGIREFGALLADWPDLWQAAQRLNGRTH